MGPKAAAENFSFSIVKQKQHRLLSTSTDEEVLQKSYRKWSPAASDNTDPHGQVVKNPMGPSASQGMVMSAED